MKLSSTKWTIITATFASSLIFAGCGIDPEALKEQQDALAAQEAAESDDDSFLLGDENDYTDESGESASDEASISDGGESSTTSRPPVFRTLKKMHKALRSSVADCLGLSEEMAAFEAKKDELIASGASRKEVKEALKEEGKALRSAIHNDREAFRTCRQQSKDTDLGVATKNIITSCWDLPEMIEGAKANGKRRKFAEKMRRGKGSKGKGGPRMPLPPKKFADFNTETCQEAVDAAQLLLGN